MAPKDQDSKNPKKGKQGGKKKPYVSPKLIAAGILTLTAIQAQAAPTSSRLVKKDIAALSSRDYAQMLNKLRATRLYRFRYMTETRSDKPRLGVIAEEAPSEVTNQRRNAIDVGSALGFIMAGMKAQEERRRVLEAEVARQRRQISALLRAGKGLSGRFRN